MTPPTAATHLAGAGELRYREPVQATVGAAVIRALDARGWSRIRNVLDVVVLYLASSAALFAAPRPDGGFGRAAAAAFPLLVLAMLNARRNPDQRLYGSALDTSAHILGIVSLAAMLTVAAGSLVGGGHPVGLALRLWLFAFVYLAVARVVLLSIHRHAMCSEALATPTLVVGAGIVGEHLVKRLMSEPRYGLRPVGFLDSNPLPRPERFGPRFIPILGGPEDLMDAVQRTGARRVILAFSSEPDHILVEQVRACERLGIEISLVPRLYEAINERTTLDHVGGLPLLSLRPTDPRSLSFAVKHAFDRAFALLALVVLAPVMYVIALGVRASSPGPMLFRQRRVGRDGHAFDLLKFRTMREPDGANRFELPEGLAPGGVEGEDRRTPFGRWLRGASLDELPQLINVVKGDMSLVGPRPERPEFVERFSSEVARYGDRHLVKSGITGWAQVNGLRGRTSIVDRVEWDNYYVKNWSLWLDLRILVLTLLEVLRFRET